MERESLEEARKLWSPETPNPALAFPRRRWWFRRVDERGACWLYLLGERLTLLKYAPTLNVKGFDGRIRMLAVYVHTKRLDVNWRPYGHL